LYLCSKVCVIMGTYVNIGNEGFESARNGENIDKSELIAVVNPTKVTEYADRLLPAGISYNRETKEHSCKIEFISNFTRMKTKKTKT